MTKILVIDDDQGIQMLYAEELTDEGYDVVTCGDGSRLMQFLKEQRPDLVVMDMKLGKTNGVDLLRDIRKTFTHLPVILCTAYASIQHEMKPLVAADGYVLKSSDLSELKLKIQNALHNRKKPASSHSQNHTGERQATPVEQIRLPWRDHP